MLHEQYLTRGPFIPRSPPPLSPFPQGNFNLKARRIYPLSIITIVRWRDARVTPYRPDSRAYRDTYRDTYRDKHRSALRH